MYWILYSYFIRHSVCVFCQTVRENYTEYKYLVTVMEIATQEWYQKPAVQQKTKEEEDVIAHY